VVEAVGPTFSPIFTVPTLLDCARICDTVRSTPPRSCASSIVRSATVIDGGRLKTWFGVVVQRTTAGVLQSRLRGGTWPAPRGQHPV